MQGIQDIVSSPYFIITWAILMIPSLIIVIRALRVNNAHLMPLMKVVWGFTVAYSGPLGLLIYWLTGRKEISDDNDWRRAFRSVDDRPGGHEQEDGDCRRGESDGRPAIQACYPSAISGPR